MFSLARLGRRHQVTRSLGQVPHNPDLRLLHRIDYTNHIRSSEMCTSRTSILAAGQAPYSDGGRRRVVQRRGFGVSDRW